MLGQHFEVQLNKLMNQVGSKSSAQCTVKTNVTIAKVLFYCKGTHFNIGKKIF